METFLESGDCLNYGGSKNYFGKLTFSKTVTFGAIFERLDLFGGCFHNSSTLMEEEVLGSAI